MRKYKLSDNYIIQQVGDDTVLLPCGTDNNVDLSKMIVLNETGAFLTSYMENSYASFDQLVAVLKENYENTSEELQNDVNEFINEMLTHGILSMEDDEK